MFKLLTRLELSVFLFFLIFIYLKQPSFLIECEFIRIFDFCMAAYFWAFVASCDREEAIELKKVSRADADDPLKHPLITWYDIFILCVLMVIKFIIDFF